MFFSTLKKRRSASCSVLPAFSIWDMKGSADPSKMGTSGPSSSSTALSMPRIQRGQYVFGGVHRDVARLQRCAPSMFLPHWRRVPIEGAPSKSFRTKTYPVFASPGRMRSWACSLVEANAFKEGLVANVC